MTLTIYTDPSHRTPLMELIMDDKGILTVHLPEPLDKINFLPQEVTALKKFLEIA